MPNTVLKGTGEIAEADTHYIKLVGKTKGKDPVIIEMPCAICTSDPEFAFNDKDDVVATLTFAGLYKEADLARGDRTPPYRIVYPSTVKPGNKEIILGGGAGFYLGTSKEDAQLVGLIRGGATFTDKREIREQRADGDPGPVDGRLQLEESRPELTVNNFEWLTKDKDLWPAMTTTTEEGAL